MALLTQADLEAKLGRSLSTSEATNFTILNQAVQTQVEKLIDSGVESVSPSTRYYDGGVQNLPISPCTSITAVGYYDENQTLVQTLLTDDYLAHPYNKTLKTMLRGRNVRFASGMSNLGVTAKFSIYEDSDTLAMVKDIMLDILTAEIENAGNVNKESIEGYSVEFKEIDSKEAFARLGQIFQMII